MKPVKVEVVRRVAAMIPIEEELEPIVKQMKPVEVEVVHRATMGISIEEELEPIVRQVNRSKWKWCVE